MSWPARRSLMVAAVGVGFGLGSGLIWPGDPGNDPMTLAHWVAVGGFLVTAVLLVAAAVLVFLAVIGNAWRVDDFKPGEYLDNMKKSR